MAFSYTEILKAASPLRGGPYSAFAMGTLGHTAAGSGAVSTTLSSAVYVELSIHGPNHQKSAFISTISGGVIAVNLGAACSGSWIAFGH